MSSQKIRIAYLNYWDDELNDRYFSKFIEYHFLGIETTEVSPFEHPDIIVCSVFGDLNLIRRLSAKIKIFYTGENLKRKEYREFQNINILQNIFDLIIGFYDTDIKSKVLCFPLWLQYYPFYSTKEDESIISHIEKQHLINKKITKDKFCTLIARHDRSGIRTRISKSVAKIGKISYGGSFHLVQFQKDHYIVPYGSKEKVDYIKSSKYNICPENSSTKGYCTEKLFEALQAGCIPIYSGHDIPTVLNKNKIIFYREDIPEEQFLQNFQSVYTFDGSVFVDKAEEIISDYYEDLKNQLAHLIRSRTKLPFNIFEPKKDLLEAIDYFREYEIDAYSDPPKKMLKEANLTSNLDSELSKSSESSESTAATSNNSTSSNCCVLEQPVIATFNEEESNSNKIKDKEVTEFVQELVNTLEILAKEKIKAKAEKRMKIFSNKFHT